MYRIMHVQFLVVCVCMKGYVSAIGVYVPKHMLLRKKLENYLDW
jgi:hypothetical protein